MIRSSQTATEISVKSLSLGLRIMVEVVQLLQLRTLNVLLTISRSRLSYVKRAGPDLILAVIKIFTKQLPLTHPITPQSTWTLKKSLMGKHDRSLARLVVNRASQFQTTLIRLMRIITCVKVIHSSMQTYRIWIKVVKSEPLIHCSSKNNTKKIKKWDRQRIEFW